MTITTDPASPDECLRCGYALRGIADDRPCPECGLLAVRSRRITDGLHDTRPRWLASLSRGTKLILLALIVGTLWTPLADFVRHEVLMTRRTAGPRVVSDLLGAIPPEAGIDLSLVVLWVGVWMLTTAEGYPPADRLDRARRRAARLLSTLLLFLVFAPQIADLTAHVWLYYSLGSMVALMFARFDRIAQCLSTAAPLSAVSLSVLVFLQLRSLAKRARSAHLAEHCAIVGTGASVAMLYIEMVRLWVEFGPDPQSTYWWERSSVALVLLLTMSLGALLFLLWAIYVLIRFAIAFHIAARELRRRWRADDRAATAQTSLAARF